MEQILTELEKRREKYRALEKELSSPDILSDREKHTAKAKEYAELRELVSAYEAYLSFDEERKELLKMIEEEGAESEYAAMAAKDLDRVKDILKKKREEIEELLLEDEYQDFNRNVIMEIRAGTGGVEASLFAADLYKMYSKYFLSKGWKTQVISLSESEKNGIKEIIFSVEGKGVFKYLRFEMGTHRVQRVPETEASGRIHTSAATVAVLPEAEDVEIDVSPQHLKIDYYRASGAGGQHVNVTDSAVRITHVPTGIVVSCQDERSQHKNKAKAMRVLKARILKQLSEKKEKERADNRKTQVGSGDRSEKIRTYNFPENRFTDHRIGLTIYNLSNILEGEMDAVISALVLEDRKMKLSY
ncbi:MAG: peptide chain release factor 1 [Candidatus Omnitrophota bacterium]|nr:peptide chain release factor 1 [Candidatus Omnitrophota bacterium]